MLKQSKKSRNIHRQYCQVNEKAEQAGRKLCFEITKIKQAIKRAESSVRRSLKHAFLTVCIEVLHGSHVGWQEQ